MEKQKMIWGKYECKQGAVFQFRGGNCSFYIKRISNGWKVSAPEKERQQQTLKLETSATFPEDGNFNLFQTGRSEQLQVLPSLPTKPVVFKTNKLIQVSPRQAIKLFLAIPCNVQLYYGQAEADQLMSEIELARLSDTWFGEPDNGVAAFANGDFYALQMDQLNPKSFEIVCPVKIINNSNQPLDLQRFIIHVENLNIYQKSGQLITNMVSIEFKGPEQISNIDHTTEKVIHGDNPQLVAKARNVVSKSILGKSFHFIKHLTQ